MACQFERRAFQRSFYRSALPPWSLSPHSPAYSWAVARKLVCGWSKVREVQNGGRWHWRGNSVHPDSGSMYAEALSACNMLLLHVHMAFLPSHLLVLCSHFLYSARSPWLHPTFKIAAFSPPVAFCILLIFFHFADQHLTYSTIYFTHWFIGYLPPIGYWLHRERIIVCFAPCSICGAKNNTCCTADLQ